MGGMNPKKVDPSGRPWRWGHPLSRDHADAIARQYADRNRLTPLEHKQREIEERQREMEKGNWNVLNEARSRMVEDGVKSMEIDIDPVLLDHSICEEECARQWGHLTGSALDQRFWECMDQCSPQRNMSYRVEDMPTSPEVPSTKTYVIPDRRS